MDVEQRLRAGLTAREPGPDFESAVMTRLAQQHAQPPRRHRAWRVPAALAATLLAATFGLHWHFENQRGAQAHQQLLLALQITSFELNQLQHRLVPNDVQEN